MFAPIDKMKWTAWMDKKGQDKQEARKEFMALAKKLLGETTE